MHEVKFCFFAMIAASAMLFAACDDPATPSSPTSPPTSVAPASRVAPTVAASPSATLAPPTTVPPPGNGALPTGFPLDPDLPADRVAGRVGSRVIEPGAGASIRDVSVDDQVSDEPARANASGWNCRTHVEYEGSPAVDWYVPTGTPVYATMDGDAILIVNTVVNAFEFYSVDREPYLGDPDRTRAGLNPFPGPGGGMGVYVAVIGEEFRTDYGHLSLAPTLAAIPRDAFVAPYSSSYDFALRFASPQPFTFGEQVGRWRVRKGDIIGYTGDAGYSEAPHLHYVITRRDTGARLCPTSEPGFDDNGWLTR